MSRLTVELRGASATEAAGAALAQPLADRSGVVFLEGELGAGKTTLTRGFLRALGVVGTVRSPTYTLMEPYEIGARTVVHMDLYRLRDPEELWGLGLDSYSPDRALWLVEWPEKGADLLPAPLLRIRLQYFGTGRTLDASGPAELIDRLRAALKDLH
ncbi:MAG: tRNA (adenosine(37)-N6)-threonylcarbamoyltransferase complex ATPase subunit type 1 TsaE [Sinimarinibacterium sp.]|jgi:tRNA threonylcarbamoyladenosine biosynthesis protein TsaE